MSLELIERAKEQLGSYAEVARFIERSPSLINEIRHGRKQLEPIHAAKLAELLGDRWYDHALPALAAQAKSAEDKAFWLGKLQALARTAGVPAAIVAGAILINSALPVSSLKPDEFPMMASAKSLIFNDNHTIHYWQFLYIQGLAVLAFGIMALRLRRRALLPAATEPLRVSALRVTVPNADSCHGVSWRLRRPGPGAYTLNGAAAA